MHSKLNQYIPKGAESLAQKTLEEALRNFKIPEPGTRAWKKAQKRAKKVSKKIMTDEQLDRVRHLSPELLMKRFNI